MREKHVFFAVQADFGTEQEKPEPCVGFNTAKGKTCFFFSSVFRTHNCRPHLSAVVFDLPQQPSKAWQPRYNSRASSFSLCDSHERCFCVWVREEAYMCAKSEQRHTVVLKAIPVRDYRWQVLAHACTVQVVNALTGATMLTTFFACPRFTCRFCF